MASYDVVIKPSALKGSRSSPSKGSREERQKIAALGETPRPVGSRTLAGAERYLLREGNYRIIYEVADAQRLVRVVRVGHGPISTEIRG